MAGRSPARFIAPLALVAFALALFIVVSSTTGRRRRASGRAGHRGARGGDADAEGRARSSRVRKHATRSSPATRPSGIAEKVDVPLDQILELNPDLDPQTLTPGTKIKLR